MPRIDELYNALNKQGLYTKSLDDFKTQFSTPEAINQLHFALKQEGLYTKPLADFNNQFFSDQLKKKEEGLPSMPSAEGGFLGTSPTEPRVPSGLSGDITEAELIDFMPFAPDEAVVNQYLPENFESLSPNEKIKATAEVLKVPGVKDVIQSRLDYQKSVDQAIADRTQAAIDKEVDVESDYFTGEFSNFLKAMDNPMVNIGWMGLGEKIDDLGRAIATGLAQGDIVEETIPMAWGGSKTPDQDIDKYIAISKKMDELGPSNEMVRFQNIYEAAGGDVFAAMKAMYHSPGAIPEILATSLSSMLNTASLSAAGTTVAGGAGAGALTGGAPGAVTGAIKAVPYAFSAANGFVEYGSSFNEFLKEELEKKGLDFTRNGIKAVLEDPEALSRIRNRASARAGTVVAIDALTANLAGSVGAKLANTTRAGQIKAAAATTGIEMAGGSIGEATARGIAGQEQDAAEILLEGVGEGPMGIVDIASAVAIRNRDAANAAMKPDQRKQYQENKAKIEALQRSADASTDETVASTMREAINSIKDQNEVIKKDVSDVVSNLSEEDKDNISRLTKEADDLKNKAIKINDDPNIDKETKAIALGELKKQAIAKLQEQQTIIDNAVQKQATSEVPVQPEARVGEEVAQGAPEAKPEVVTEEGVQEEVTIDAPAIVANTKPEVDVVVAAAPEVETGQTFNSDGTVYSNGGLVVPVTSENITQQELTPERIAEFVEANKAKIGSNAVKVGIYKFPNSNKVSLDLNIVVPKENRAAALEFGKMAGQESLFDLDTFENVKTGADGMNPMSFTDDQFKQIAKSLSEGKVPDFMMTPADQATVGQTIQNTAQSLQVAFPEVEFIVGDNLEDTRARIVEALTPRVGMEKAQEVANDFKDVRGQALFAGDRPVAIVVDKTAANTRTAGHEAWEVMLNDAFGKNPEKFAEFRKSIDRQLRLSGFNDIAEELRAFSETYSKEGNEVVFREYMAEFGGMLVEGGFDIQNLTPQQKSFLQKIKDIINDFAMQLTGKEVFLKDATAENIIDFMSTISQKVAKGETVEEFFETKDTTEIENTDTVFKNRSQKIGDFDIYYFEDEAEFQKLVEDGLVVQNASIDEAAGEPVAVHQPDNLFVGNLSYKGKKIMDGNGGVYYVLKFGNVWASGAKSSASGLVKLINESREKSSDKKARLVLVRGSQDKMISSVQGVKAAMQILEELVFSGLISTSDFRTALKAAGKKYNIDFSGTSSASSIKADIENKFMNVSDSTFEKRGTFFSDLVDELGKLESPKKNIKEIQKAIGAKKNIRFTKQGIREQLGTIMTERLLLGLPSSHAYAMIEVDEDVTFKEDKEHPSYPYAIVTKSGKPPVLKIFGYRPKAVEAIRRIDGSPASNAQLGLAQRGMGIGRVATDTKITARAQKKAPAAISEDVYKYLTEDDNGNIVFHHYSSSQRDQIKPSSGQGSLLTSKEEQQALSSVGGLAMYYAQEGQKEPGVGNELHTVVVPRDKVYDIRKDPMNFYDEAKERFLEHMNRNNTGKPIEYAFSPNYQVAWITKVAGENGFDMTVAQWKNKADYRAQSTKTLTPEAENIKMKPIEGEIEVGDLVQIYGQESVITDIDENGVLSYVQKGSSGKFDLPMSKRSMRMGKATLLDKGPYIFDEAKQEPVKETITARAQKLTSEEIKVLNENFGIQDGKVELKARSQKITPSEVKAVSESLSSLSESKLESLKELIHKDVKAPQKTQKAYKLFKVKKNFPGELFPLFVGANESVTTGDWIEAKAGELTTTKEGKTMVKSTLGPLAYRPGWHSGEFAIATHIGAKKNASDKAPSLRDSDQVWAEVEVGDDFDWQTEANRRADRNKNGDIVPRTAHITDQIPSGGNYKYKTNSNMTGSWIISGEMKVNRVLTDEEVARINKQSGSNDLPRLAPFDFEAYGFNQDGTPKDKKQVISNQVARAYIIAKETGDNPELVSAVDSSTTITARAQKINYKDLPGYDRMRNKVDGIIEKATKRGATKARIADDVINYVQKSAVYERANDSQRDQMIRDLKKELGQRVKSAPKADRLLGTIKDAKKVTVDEMMALKEKIKAEAKAAKDAVAFINGIRARIAQEIKAMEKSGVLSAKQVQTIINKASKVNLTKPDAVNNFVDYMEKVFKNAEYGEKLSQSNTLQRKIKNLSKSDSVAAGTKAIAKQFAKIEPRRVGNIEEYLEYASSLYNAMKPTTGRVTEEGADVSFKSAVEYDKIQDYANEEIKRQEKQKVDEILARNEDLVMAGILTEDMNIDEIKKIIDAINSEDPKTLPPAEKEKMIRDYVKKAFGYYRTIALSMIQRGVDPFTGEEIELTESQKKLARRFLEVDTDMMPLKEAYAAVEAIDNFIVNKVTDGMAATIADYVGQVNAKNLAKEGYRGKPLRLFYSKNAGRAWAEQIEQLDLMVQRMFGGVNRALAFMRASGANAFKVGKTTTQVQLNNMLNKYAAKFGEVKGFRDLENVMERGVLAFVSRSVNENSTKQQNEFERRKALVEETLAYMKTGTEKEQSQAVELQKVYDNILKGSSSIDQVESKVKDFNKDAVKFWVDEWSSKYDDLQDLSRNVYNVVLGSDINYTPDRFKRVSGKDVAEAQWGESMFADSSDYFDTKEAGVLMENKRIQTLGKRPSRIVSFDFDVNMSNSMYDALMDINTAEATRQMKSFFNSDGFEKIVPTKEDRDLMVDRMKKFVIRSKRKDYVSQDQLSGVFKAMNTIAGLGAGRALGGILQAPKQTIGVAFNTMINSGGRLSVVDAIQANQFINDSGYAIALRGIASNADIQSINKILEKASQTKGDAALKLLNKASEMWLNTFLVKPDVWIARTSWISYYKQQLDKMGYDTSNMDWSSHKLNKEAADYAQAMLDRQQNYSDSDLAGEFFASKEPMKMFLRKTFFPFMTFVMNQKSRMYADLSIIGNKEASTQEKINAGKSLTGMAIEMGVYSAMSMFFANLLTEMTDALWGYDEDEEEKKKRMKRSSQYYAKNIVMDVLSPLPVTNEVVRITINKGLEAVGIDKDTFELPKNFESGSWMSDFGMNAIAAEKMLSAYDKLHMAATGEYTKQDFFGNDVTMQLDEEAKQKMAYVALADFMYSLGLAPTEIGSMANKATGRAKKTGKKVKESGSQPGGVIKAKVIQAK